MVDLLAPLLDGIPGSSSLRASSADNRRSRSEPAPADRPVLSDRSGSGRERQIARLPQPRVIAYAAIGKPCLSRPRSVGHQPLQRVVSRRASRKEGSNGISVIDLKGSALTKLYPDIASCSHRPVFKSRFCVFRKFSEGPTAIGLLYTLPGSALADHSVTPPLGQC